LKPPIALFPIAAAWLLAACDKPSTAPPAASAPASAAAAPPVATASAEPAGEKVPLNAAIRFHWFAYASPTHDAHKLWLEPMDPQKPLLTLTYSPDTGAPLPREQVPSSAREPLTKALEASNLNALLPASPKPGVEAKWNYVLSVSWPREGQAPFSHTVSWTDATETPQLAAVRRALFELATSKFPVVVKAAPRP
jgi:hypothetical protein